MRSDDHRSIPKKFWNVGTDGLLGVNFFSENEDPSERNEFVESCSLPDGAEKHRGLCKICDLEKIVQNLMRELDTQKIKWRTVTEEVKKWSIMTSESIRQPWKSSSRNRTYGKYDEWTCFSGSITGGEEYMSRVPSKKLRIRIWMERKSKEESKYHVKGYTNYWKRTYGGCQNHLRIYAQYTIAETPTQISQKPNDPFLTKKESHPTKITSRRHSGKAKLPGEHTAWLPLSPRRALNGPSLALSLSLPRLSRRFRVSVPQDSLRDAGLDLRRIETGPLAGVTVIQTGREQRVGSFGNREY